MKSNRRKKIIAAVLCMVMVLSSNISALAGEEIFADTPVVVEEPDSESAAVSETELEAVTEDPEEVTEDPEEVSETDGVEVFSDETEVSFSDGESGEEAAETFAEEPEQQPETDFGDGTGTEEQVLSGATELKQEFVDAEGNVIWKVTANLPAGAFAAETSAITMEVSCPDTASDNYIKSMMTERISEGMQLGSYVLFDIRFKVNGEKAEAFQPVTVTIEGSGLSAADTKKATVFYFDPADAAVEGDKDELKEIPQRSAVLESLQAAGQSTENIEDYDLSEITWKEDGTTDRIIFEGRDSTVYGCYTEEETPAEEKPETPAEPVPEEEIEIISDEVNLRTGPDEAADNVAAAAYAGERYPLLESVQVEETLWYRILYTYPENGGTEELYVRSDFAKIVEADTGFTDEEAMDTIQADPVKSLNYSDDQIDISVNAYQENIIPEDAELQVTPIIAGSEEYADVEQKVQEKVAEEEKEVAGFLAYDITFVDPEGNRLEPNGEVKVSMNYKPAAIPETVTEEKAETTEVAVYHLEENAEGQVQNVVDMTAAENAHATIETTEAAEIQSAEFLTTGFSVYTVVWKDYGDRRNRPTATLHFVNKKGDDISGKIGVKENKIEIDNNGNLGGNSADHRDLNGIGEQYSGENGYYYEEAHLDKYNGELVADDISYNPSDKNEYDWHYLAGGSWHGWKKDYHGQNRKVDVYLVYTTEKPEPLSTVATINARSRGVTMKMIDLGGNGSTTLTNGKATVDFGSGSGYGNGTIKKNLLSSTAGRDGFPTVRNDSGSLGRLFHGAVEADYLFRQDIYDNSGYFEYSSFENYAYLNGNTFQVYKQIGTPDNGNNYFYQRGNFMPYNQIVEGRFSRNKNYYDENGKALASNAPRYGERLYKTQGTNNFQFGMLVEAEFTQQRNGMAAHNGTKSPMIYEFNGDDDLWIYIDNVLVLDIGGVHDAHSGSIDFSTGIVRWNDCETGKAPVGYSTTLKKLFKKAGVLPSGKRWTEAGAAVEFRGETFADYTTDHSFKMYYFERGLGASNLHVKFNLPTVPKNSVNVQKVVQNQNGEDITYAEDIDFLFQIEVEGQKYVNQPYDIIEGNSTVGTGITDENAKFTLKHDQTARFHNIESDKNYRVKELGAYLDGYEVQLGGTTIWTPDGGASIPEADSGELNAGEKSTVVFINRMIKSAELNITKKLAQGTRPSGETFEIELKLGGKLYTGSYKIGKNTYSAKDGIIKLEAGQTAVITGLPCGVTFEARELMDGSYLPSYGITGEEVVNIKLPAIREDGASNGTTSASAQINGGECTLTVTNREIPVGSGSTDVSVEKKWENMSGIPIPEYVDVYLYKDENHNGKLDESDTDMGYDPIRLDGIKNSWKGKWKAVPGDTDYVIKEVYPPGYKLLRTESDNSFSKITEVGERTTPDHGMVFNLGRNNVLLVRDAEDKYFLWTPVQLNFNQDDLKEITNAIRNLRPDGVNNLNDNLSYAYGEGKAHDIELEETENGWTVSFTDTGVWSRFWTFEYQRDLSIALVNAADKDAYTSLRVEKQWRGDDPLNRPESVTVQLYKNGEAEGRPVTLTLKENNWKHTFKSLPVYTVDNNGSVIKNVYTVKEIRIGDKETDQNGRAAGYQSSVTEAVDEDGITRFIITNVKDWQIIKVSENSRDVKLEGAVFKLTKGDFEIYGKSDENGVVSWYTDEDEPYGQAFENGQYTLEEIKAPSGYVKSEEIWTITINNGSADITSGDGVLQPETLNGKDTFYFRNTPDYGLPSTGGSGIFGYVTGGVALMIAALFILYKMRSKETLRS